MMAPQNNIHYENAPITEAIIDVRVEVPPDITVEHLHKIKTNNPSYSVNDLKVATWMLKLEDIPTGTQTADSKHTGYALKSEDEKRIYQVKLDGFAASRVAPYKDWEDLRNEAYRVWNEYKAAVNPTRITRLAVRFINRFDIPLPVNNFEDYLRTLPTISPDLPQLLSGFFMQITLPLPSIRGTAVVSQAIAPPFKSDTVAVVLDIDVFCEVSTTDDINAWAIIDQLRNEKNKIFESSITEKMRELIR